MEAKYTKNALEINAISIKTTKSLKVNY